MKILQHLTELVQIYKAHTFPFDQLRYQKNISKLQQLFHFEIVNSGQSGYIEQPLLIEYRNGFFENYNVKRLFIEQRKIVLYIESESSVAQKASQSLFSFFSSLKENYSQSIEIETIRTEIISNLNFEFKTILSPRVNKLIKFILSNDNSINQSIPFGFKHKINYKTPENLLLDGIILSDKEFVFERRAGSTENENMFYTSLPFATDKHVLLLQLIEELNQ